MNHGSNLDYHSNLSPTAFFTQFIMIKFQSLVCSLCSELTFILVCKEDKTANKGVSKKIEMCTDLKHRCEAQGQVNVCIC